MRAIACRLLPGSKLNKRSPCHCCLRFRWSGAACRALVADHRDRAYYVDPVDGSYQADHPFDGDYRELYRALSSALANASKTPTKGEVEEMAAYLGIAERPALAWVAQQAVLAPLPEGWEEREGTEAASTADGGTQAVDGGKDEPAAVVLFYYDKKTGQSSREHPLDPTFRRLATIEAMRLDELVNAAALGERGEGPRMEAPDLEAMSWMHLADDENGQLYEYNWMTGKRVDLDLADEAAVAEVGADGGIEEVVASAGASDGAQVQAVPSVRDVHTGALRPAVSDAALEFDKLAADDQADDEGDSKAATPTPASLPPGARRMPLTTRSKSVRRSPLSRSASGNVKLPPLRSTQYVSHAEAVETLQSAVGAASAYVAGWARYALGSVTGAKGDDAK